MGQFQFRNNNIIGIDPFSSLKELDTILRWSWDLDWNLTTVSGIGIEIEEIA